MEIQFGRKHHLFKIEEPHASLSGMCEGNEVWILSLNVDNESRGKGIGAEMMRCAFQQFYGQTFYLFALAEEPDRQQALERFYRRLGFEVFGPQKAGTATLMRRIL